MKGEKIINTLNIITIMFKVFIKNILEVIL